MFSLSLLIFWEMIVLGKPINCYTLPVVLKSCIGLSPMYEKCGDLDVARKVFDGMHERNEFSWSALMSGYGMHWKLGEVFGLSERVVEEGQKEYEVSFTTLLTTCSHGVLIERRREYFRMMRMRFGLRPALEHYTYIVDMLGRVGQVEEAKKLIIEVEPGEALWGALLSACRIHGKTELADRWGAQTIYQGKEN